MMSTPKTFDNGSWDWRGELENDPRVVMYRKATEKAWDRLQVDKEFLFESERLKRALKKVCGDSEEKKKKVYHFFQRFAGPIGSRIPSIRRKIKSLKEQDLRLFFSRYVRFAVRFGVFVRLNRKGQWECILHSNIWNCFHMKMVKGTLRPVDVVKGDEHYIDLFAAEELEELKKLPQIQKLLEAGHAKFVRIEDDDLTSPLSRLEEVCLSPTTITFIYHKAEQPYLLLLVGEQVSSAVWRKAGKAVRSFQQLFQERSHAGRRRDIAKLKLDFEKLRRKGMQKANAIPLKGNPWSPQSRLSKTKRELEKYPVFAKISKKPS